MRFVVKKNVEEQNNAGAGGEQKKDDSQAGIAPDAEAGVHPHEQSRADDERSDDQPDCDAIGDFLEAEDERFLIDGIHRNFQLIVGQRVDEFVQTARQALNQILQLEYAAEKISRRQTFDDALLHDGGCFAANGGIRVELGRERTCDLV